MAHAQKSVSSIAYQVLEEGKKSPRMVTADGERQLKKTRNIGTRLTLRRISLPPKKPKRKNSQSFEKSRNKIKRRMPQRRRKTKKKARRKETKKRRKPNQPLSQNPSQ